MAMENCAALPESLIESEIFGHEKGAFTGAVDRRLGAMEQAQAGTLFLDELGEMPLPMQAKLLRVLEDLRFRRLGGKQELQADVRIIAATNRDPLKSIKDGTLREDLYYRLNVFHIHLPPLRERMEDIPRIVEAMIDSMNDRHGTKVQSASSAFYETLIPLTWEGNVRELRNLVERAVIIAGEGSLEPRHAAYGLKRTAPPAKVEQLAESNGGVRIDVGMTIDEAERLLIEATLAHAGNNKTRAALILGISTKTMHVVNCGNTGWMGQAVGTRRRMQPDSGYEEDRNSRLIASFAHDLRASLRSIMMNVQRLQRRPPEELTPETQARLDEILAAARRQEELIASVVEFDQAQYPGMGADSPLPLRIVIQTACMKVDALRQAKKGSISFDSAAVPVVLVPSLLSRAIEKVLDNSLKFNPAGQTPQVTDNRSRGFRQAA